MDGAPVHTCDPLAKVRRKRKGKDLRVVCFVYPCEGLRLREEETRRDERKHWGRVENSNIAQAVCNSAGFKKNPGESMRIRKPSIAVLSSSPREKLGGASSTAVCRDNDEKAQKKNFVLQLGAAVMDAEAHFAADATPGAGMPEIHSRPAHNWRNLLLRCNAQRESVQVSEKHKPNYGSNGILRIREDQMRLLISKGEDTSSKLVVDGEWEVPKLDLLEKSLASMTHAKRKRSSGERHAKWDFNTAERKEIVVQRVKKPVKDYAGCQCRRRNGRGWRCPERTLVGYYLCEHHLGKGRLKCINGHEGGVVVNSKGTKFKELRLIEAACKVEDPLPLR